METYKVFYTINGVTYSFTCEFTIPKNHPNNDHVFSCAINNDKERRLLDGKVTDWYYKLLQHKIDS